MKSGEDECCYILANRREIVDQMKNIDTDDLSISPAFNEYYKYHGLDKIAAYSGKTRVTKEYFNRLWKQWNSELSAFS